MGRGKFKGKPTGRRQFSTPEEIGIAQKKKITLNFIDFIVRVADCFHDILSFKLCHLSCICSFRHFRSSKDISAGEL